MRITVGHHSYRDAAFLHLLNFSSGLSTYVTTVIVVHSVDTCPRSGQSSHWGGGT
jgi:hypothetical protein